MAGQSWRQPSCETIDIYSNCCCQIKTYFLLKRLTIVRVGSLIT